MLINNEEAVSFEINANKVFFTEFSLFFLEMNLFSINII